MPLGSLPRVHSTGPASASTAAPKVKTSGTVGPAVVSRAVPDDVDGARARDAAVRRSTVTPGTTAIDVALPDLAPLLAPFADPSFPRGMPPHVTLLYPWRPAPLDDDDVDALARALTGVPPVRVRIGPVRRFDADRLLYLAVEPFDALQALMRRMADAFPETPPYAGAIADPIPHVTVRRCADADECAEWTARLEHALADHRPVDVIADHVTVHELGADDTWRARVALPLPVRTSAHGPATRG